MHVELCLNLNMIQAKYAIPGLTEFLRCLWLMRNDVQLGVTVVDADGENTLVAKSLNPVTFPNAIKSLYGRDNVAQVIDRELEPGDMDDVVGNIPESDLLLVLTRAPRYAADLQSISNVAEKRAHGSVQIVILREDQDTPTHFNISPSSIVSVNYVVVSDDLEMFKMRKQWLRDLSPSVSAGLRLSPGSGVFVDLSPSLVPLSSATFEDTLFQGSRPLIRNGGVVVMETLEFVNLKTLDFSLLYGVPVEVRCTRKSFDDYREYRENVSTFRALCVKLLEDDVGLHVVIPQVNCDDDDDDDNTTEIKLHFLILPDKTTGLSELCMYRVATSEMLIVLTSSRSLFDINTLSKEDQDSKRILDDSMSTLSKVCYNPIEHQTHFEGTNRTWKELFIHRRRRLRVESTTDESDDNHRHQNSSRPNKKAKNTTNKKKKKKKKRLGGVITVEKLRSMTCLDLRELARDSGLKMCGRKADLIRRLSEHYLCNGNMATMKYVTKEEKGDEDDDEIESV